MYHRDPPQEISWVVSTTALGLLYGGEKVQRLSNACVRYITGTRRDEHITPDRKRLGWLRTDSRRSYFAVLLIYKILWLREPSYLAAFFEENKPRPMMGRFKFSVKLWNSPPPPPPSPSVRSLPSFSSFNRAVRRHLLEPSLSMWAGSYQHGDLQTFSSVISDKAELWSASLTNQLW